MIQVINASKSPAKIAAYGSIKSMSVSSTGIELSIGPTAEYRVSLSWAEFARLQAKANTFFGVNDATSHSE